MNNRIKNMKLLTIKIKKCKYVSCDDIMKNAPVYSKGSRNTRTLIKKKDIEDDMFIYARLNDKGKWKKSDGKSIKFDKIFLKYDFLKTIPEISGDDNVVDDKGIKKAPPIIHLNDNEKFQDDEGNILEIETRGERKCDKIYFKVKDVAKGFDIERLKNSIIIKTSRYTQYDYTYFICKKNNNVGKNKNKVKKELFLTYEGMLRALFVSRTGKAHKFIKWATETLFTIQMGTQEQKEDLTRGILGIPAKQLRQVLSKSTSYIPCIYRFALGKCEDLRETMNISHDIPNNYTVIKYGYSDNLVRRTREHMKTYKSIKNTKLELMNYTYIDPKHLSTAEVDIKEFFEDIEIPIKYDKQNELVAINPKHEKTIKKYFEYIANKYAGCVADLNKKIDELKRDIVNKDLEIKNMNKLHELEIERNNERHKNELLIKQNKINVLEKDLEIERMRNELLQLKNNV